MSGAGFSFRPYFDGEVAVDRVPDDFFERMELRLADGLLVRGQRRRANYRVTVRSTGTLEFEAQGFLTAYAIGLNHVRLQRAGRTAIRYEVGFARWTRYAVIHGWLIGLLIGAACLLPGAWRDIESYPHGPLLFGAMVLFWALAWPWLLTAIHRPFARQALERILREELEAAPVLRAAP